MGIPLKEVIHGGEIGNLTFHPYPAPFFLNFQERELFGRINTISFGEFEWKTFSWENLELKHSCRGFGVGLNDILLCYTNLERPNFP